MIVPLLWSGAKGRDDKNEREKAAHEIVMADWTRKLCPYIVHRGECFVTSTVESKADARVPQTAILQSDRGPGRSTSEGGGRNGPLLARPGPAEPPAIRSLSDGKRTLSKAALSSSISPIPPSPLVSAPRSHVLCPLFGYAADTRSQPPPLRKGHERGHPLRNTATLQHPHHGHNSPGSGSSFTISGIGSPMTIRAGRPRRVSRLTR
jgi:hypothetical protein